LENNCNRYLKLVYKYYNSKNKSSTMKEDAKLLLEKITYTKNKLLKEKDNVEKKPFHLKFLLHLWQSSLNNISSLKVGIDSTDSDINEHFLLIKLIKEYLLEDLNQLIPFSLYEVIGYLEKLHIQIFRDQKKIMAEKLVSDINKWMDADNNCSFLGGLFLLPKFYESWDEFFESWEEERILYLAIDILKLILNLNKFIKDAADLPVELIQIDCSLVKDAVVRDKDRRCRKFTNYTQTGDFIYKFIKAEAKKTKEQEIIPENYYELIELFPKITKALKSLIKVTGITF